VATKLGLPFQRNDYLSAYYRRHYFAEKNWRGEVVMFRGEEIDNKLHGDVGEL